MNNSKKSICPLFTKIAPKLILIMKFSPRILV